MGVIQHWSGHLPFQTGDAGTDRQRVYPTILPIPHSNRACPRYDPTIADWLITGYSTEGDTTLSILWYDLRKGLR